MDLSALEREVLDARAALDETTSTAESKDGLIQATANGRARLVELVLDPRIYRTQDAEALATDIVDAARRAGEQAQREVVESMRALLPPDVPSELVDPEFDAFLHHIDRVKGSDA